MCPSLSGTQTSVLAAPRDLGHMQCECVKVNGVLPPGSQQQPTRASVSGSMSVLDDALIFVDLCASCRVCAVAVAPAAVAGAWRLLRSGHAGTLRQTRGCCWWHPEECLGSQGSSHESR